MNYNYNPNPYSNYNDPNFMNPQIQTTTTRPISECSRCSGRNYYLDPYGARLDCHDHIYPSLNYMPPQQNVYPVQRQPENIFKRTYHAIKECVTCGGRGFIQSWNNPREKYCNDCIRAGGYCPKCNNTGYKLKNGKRCKCGMY